MNTIKLSLLVIRTDFLSDSLLFYTALGLKFVSEKHANGPQHYSTQIGDSVLEIYPSTSKNPPDKIRLGLQLEFDIKATLNDFNELRLSKFNHWPEPQIDLESLSAILIDPDGRKVELSQIT